MISNKKPLLSLAMAAGLFAALPAAHAAWKESWECSDILNLDPIFTLHAAGDVGVVEVAELEIVTGYYVEGFAERNWVWGCEDDDGCNYQLSMDYRGKVGYYDFSDAAVGERVSAAVVANCKRSP